MPGIVSGETILAVAMTEPSTGSDLAGMKTRAVEDGDAWVLNGAKTYISNGILGDLIVVAARTDPVKPHGMSLFLVERGMPGFERGRKLAKMGLKSQDTAELFFNDVRVPQANLLGEAGQGFKYLARFLAQERLVAAIGFMATAQTAFDLTLSYVKERRAFGKPIGAFQNTRFTMAEMRSKLDMAQTYVDQLVLLLNAGTLTAEDASSAKLVASELEGGSGGRLRAAARRSRLHGRISHQPDVHRRPHQPHLRRHQRDHEGDHRPQPGAGRAQDELNGHALLLRGRTYCRMCQAFCGMVATVAGGRLVKVRGDRDDPMSLGYACFKGLQRPNIITATGGCCGRCCAGMAPCTRRAWTRR